jgi:hypothetical protein
LNAEIKQRLDNAIKHDIQRVNPEEYEFWKVLTETDYMCPFSFLQTIRKIAWSKGDNSSELSNFDAIAKKKCRLPPEGKEKGRR